MKKSFILSALLSVAVLATSFAATTTNNDNTKTATTTVKAKKIATPALSDIERAFYNEINEFYYQTFEKPANKLMNPTEKLENRVVVYNLAGEVIATQQNAIPSNADFLMTEGETNYYLVSQ